MKIGIIGGGFIGFSVSCIYLRLKKLKIIEKSLSVKILIMSLKISGIQCIYSSFKKWMLVKSVRNSIQHDS